MTLDLVATALAGIALSAGTGPPLDIKPGLWEAKSTTSTKLEGDFKPLDASKLDPEQRARVEAARARTRSGKPRTFTYRSCVTEGDIRNGFRFDEAADDGDCERRYTDRSPRHVALEVRCASGDAAGLKSDGKFEITVKNPDAVVAHGEMKVQVAGKESQTRFELEARRLGANCGDLKPGESRKVQD
ncbi:MAG TPA: DUF3617 family protein [Anaeromyxobacteraceae bacterium]|nr:DUF3617 family protein [Anaeromyxobacteraceae bacterium]